ncbi:MAG: succinate dehydrogenase, hydrophobic membrane anchor protein [Methylococcales bacterium]|nr:succinate dehydrogenase, hydrophobic membrane anchor protein [Methylococcales bacterium]
MNYKTPLATILGLGSAKTGLNHWWMQRITAIALIPLTFWVVAFFKQLGDVNHTQMVTWLSEPLNSLLAVSFIISAFYHAALGLQVVIEDYVKNEASKITAVWSVKLSFLFLALAALLSLLRIILG